MEFFFLGIFQKKLFANVLIKENGKFKTWEKITCQFEIDKNLYFKWVQQVHAIKTIGKEKLTGYTTNSLDISHLNHRLMKRNQIHFVEKLTVKELYLISSQYETTTLTYDQPKVF